MNNVLISKGPYFAFAVVVLVGLYLMIAHRNLVTAVIGLAIFQNGIILFFILIAYQFPATVPILTEEATKAYKHDPGHAQVDHAAGAAHAEGNADHTDAPSGALDYAAMPHPSANGSLDPADAPTKRPYANPIPHALMLTAIVVGVATLGLAIAILLRMQAETGSVEDELGEADAGRQEVTA